MLSYSFNDALRDLFAHSCNGSLDIRVSHQFSKYAIGWCRYPCNSCSYSRSRIFGLCNNMHSLLDIYGLNGNENTWKFWGSSCLLVLHIYTLCTPCCICGSLFRDFDKYLQHSTGVASGGLQWQSLLQAHFEAIPQSIPIIALSFVYQNVVPVLCTNLEGDLSKVRYFKHSLVKSCHHIKQLPFPSAASWKLAVLKLPSGQSKPLPYLLTLLPPLVLSLLDPDVFYKALDFAGTYGGKLSAFFSLNVAMSVLHPVLVLFGVLPAAMSWSERYSKSALTPITDPLVPGGRSTLIIVTGGAFFVIFSEILKDVMHQ
ncbi:hypothetical protein BHE74_00024579 [Ensete ventricosum]|nr:hypothetical protein BHE74_00024579 [Ensete ventricosum]